MQLSPSRLKFGFLLAACLVFLAVSIYVIATGDEGGWFGVALFAPCVLLLAIRTIPGRSYLELTADGFSFRGLHAIKGHRWAEVEGFRRWTSPGKAASAHVAYDIAAHAEPQTGFRAFWLKLDRFFGAEATLPDSYGLRVDELVDLMNAWKAFHSPTPPSTTG